MTLGERIVKQMIINFRVCVFKICHKSVECIGVALTDSFSEPSVEIYERDKNEQTPYGAEEVEQEVACRGALGSHITAERCKNGGDSRTDIGAKHKRTCKVESYPALGAHDKRYGECSG